MDSGHLLVIGSPRSGTSLLAAMLGCHPDIALLHEEFTPASLSILSKPVRGVKVCVPNQIEIDKHASYALYGLQQRFGSMRRLGNALGIPRSVWSIRMYQALGNLKVVATLRHPADVVASIMRRGGKSRRTAEKRWARATEIIHLLKSETPEDVFVVPYDTLVTSPEPTLRAVLVHLGLDFDARVLEGFKHTPNYQGRTTIEPGRAHGINGKVSGALELFERNTDLKRKYDALLKPYSA